MNESFLIDVPRDGIQSEAGDTTPAMSESLGTVESGHLEGEWTH